MYLLELAGEDDGFAVQEARTACDGVRRLAPGLAAADTVSLDRIRGLAFTHRLCRSIANSEPVIDDAVGALADVSLDRSGSVAVRARDVRGRTGVDTRAAEVALGDVLVQRGFTVDLEAPEHECRALFTPEGCWLGWLLVEAVRDFADRKPTDKPFFQPGSMDPPLARAIGNLAGAGPDRLIIDPMCGTGGLLVEAGLVGAGVVGVDIQRRMTRGATRNFARYLEPHRWAVLRGDASHLPFRDDVADGVVFDAPYGRQSRIAAAGHEPLVEAALAETVRLAPRAVVVSDRDLRATVEAAGWRLEERFERRVHRSLTRYVHTLVRDRR